MIDYKALELLNGVIPPGRREFKSRKDIWTAQLKLDESTPFPEVLRRAVRATIGNFNFWEGDNGDVTWPENIGGSEWFRFAVGDRTLDGFNFQKLRQNFLAAGEEFLQAYPENRREDCLTDVDWWAILSRIYGNDPLRKRETLLAIVLYDLGYEVLWPMLGCIDYNVIITLRSRGIVHGFMGNHFSLESETLLRMECLVAIMHLLKERPDLDPSKLDDVLYFEGKRIRKQDPGWEKFMCYRPGCYFY